VPTIKTERDVVVKNKKVSPYNYR